jgi:hypothetical protein
MTTTTVTANGRRRQSEVVQIPLEPTPGDERDDLEDYDDDLEAEDLYEWTLNITDDVDSL